MFFNVICKSMENFEERIVNNIDLNYGGRIILPHRCLSEIASKCQGELPNPMLFKIINRNSKSNTITHCGVFDFSNLSTAFIPSWVMMQLKLRESDEIKVEVAYLPIATYSRLKPITAGFGNITEPVVVLEICLRQYSCLTINDIISILYNKKIYEFKVEDLKPSKAVNIIECDMNVEFSSEDLDYSEIKKKKFNDDDYKITSDATQKLMTFKGTGQRLDGKEKKVNEEENLENNLLRGIPNYEYNPGTLNFYRRGVLMDDINKQNEKPNVTVPFSGQGLNLK